MPEENSKLESNNHVNSDLKIKVSHRGTHRGGASNNTQVQQMVDRNPLWTLTDFALYYLVFYLIQGILPFGLSTLEWFCIQLHLLHSNTLFKWISEREKTSSKPKAKVSKKQKVLIFIAVVSVATVFTMLVSFFSAAIIAALQIKLFYPASESGNFLRIASSMVLARDLGYRLTCHCRCECVPLSPLGIKIESFLCHLDKLTGISGFTTFQRVQLFIVVHLTIFGLKAGISRIKDWYGGRGLRKEEIGCGDEEKVVSVAV